MVICSEICCNCTKKTPSQTFRKQYQPPPPKTAQSARLQSAARNPRRHETEIRESARAWRGVQLDFGAAAAAAVREGHLARSCAWTPHRSDKVTPSPHHYNIHRDARSRERSIRKRMYTRRLMHEAVVVVVLVTCSHTQNWVEWENRI